MRLESVQRIRDDRHTMDCKPARMFHRRSNECFEFAGGVYLYVTGDINLFEAAGAACQADGALVGRAKEAGLAKFHGSFPDWGSI